MFGCVSLCKIPQPATFVNRRYRRRLIEYEAIGESIGQPPPSSQDNDICPAYRLVRNPHEALDIATRPCKTIQCEIPKCDERKVHPSTLRGLSEGMGHRHSKLDGTGASTPIPDSATTAFSKSTQHKHNTTANTTNVEYTYFLSQVWSW